MDGDLYSAFALNCLLLAISSCGLEHLKYCIDDPVLAEQTTVDQGLFSDNLGFTALMLF